MGDRTNIGWTDMTFNPVIGCSKVSLGCANCYAEELAGRYGWAEWGKGKPRKRTSEANWKKPLKWNRDVVRLLEIRERCATRASSGLCELTEGGNSPEPDSRISIRRPRVFCASLSDWLDDDWPIEWLADLMKLIHDTPNLDWLLLSKRVDFWSCRILEAIGCDLRLERHGKAFNDWLTRWANGHAPDNCWMGTSVENQAYADKRIPELLKIPAKVRFLSVEPLLEKVVLNLSGIDWVIVGGESGPNRRDCGVEAIIDVAKQCKAAGVPCFVKQDSAAKPGQQGRIPDHIWKLKEFPR